MAYSLQEKLEFQIKDAKYSIGMAMGNAFSKAVDFYLSTEKTNFGKSEKKALRTIEGLRDMFFKSNQAKMEEEIANYLEANIGKWKEQLGFPPDDVNVVPF